LVVGKLAGEDSKIASLEEYVSFRYDKIIHVL
jgi:hypothetical protein